jgi:hypothetical protein
MRQDRYVERAQRTVQRVGAAGPVAICPESNGARHQVDGVGRRRFRRLPPRSNGQEKLNNF